MKVAYKDFLYILEYRHILSIEAIKRLANFLNYKHSASTNPKPARSIEFPLLHTQSCCRCGEMFPH